MNNGDKVRVKPNHHRPSRVGQTAKIIAQRSVGQSDRTQSFQYFIAYDRDNQPDWVDERYLELIEENHEYDEVIEELNSKPVEEVKPNPNVSEVGGKRVLNL